MSHLTRRDFLRNIAGTAAGFRLAGSWGAKPADAPPVPRPNVIIVFNDQLRALALGSYGGGQNVTTPHLDQMAQEGMRFSNAVTACPLCTPFRGMLMTGRYPTHSGLVINNLRPNVAQRCIAHVFRDAGYRAGFIGKWHLYYPRGENYIPVGPRRLGFEHWEAYNFQDVFMNTPYYRDDPTELYMNGYEMDAEIDMALSFIAGCKASATPFILVVAPHPPHSPRNAANTPAGYIEQVPATLWWPPNYQSGGGGLSAARYYYAMIKNADDNMGRLLQFLDDEGLSNDTIVIYTADHGDMLGSHGLSAKNYPYAESVNIPMIARWPGHIPAGAVTDALHTPIDHLPTLCGLTGLLAPDTADGVDLSSLMTGAGTVDRDAVLMANYSSSLSGFETGTTKPEWRAVKTKTHTYIKWLAGSEELYDNIADPYQMNNLAGEPAHAATLDELRARLAALLAAAHDEFLPGTAYADWVDANREIIRTGLGPVNSRVEVWQEMA